MPRIEVDLHTPDGPCHATLHVPADGLPAPAAILFPDAAGPRETFRAVADRLAATGYAVLLPDVYHRLGDWRPFDAETVFSDPPERERLMTMARSVTAEMTARDAGAFLAFLAGRPEVAGPRVGVFGYCMGGRAALLVAGRFPDQVGAAASFHGGRLADPADPDSPDRLADRVQAAVYVAAAENDETFPPEQYARLEAAYTAAGVQHTMEVYPAAHGFAVPDNATYDAAADERHRAALHSALRHTSAGRPLLPRKVADLDFTGLGPATPSPSAWADEVLYFLLVDRFSDGQGGRRARSRRRRRRRHDPAVAARGRGTAVQTDADAQAWRAAGVGWVGGTLAGLRSKLGYLARLGVTALWVSPVLKQAAPAPGAVASNYHGYATQDFLAVDPPVRRRGRAARAGRRRARRGAAGDPRRRPEPRGRRVRLRPRRVFDAAVGRPRVPGGGLADPGGPRAVHARGRRRRVAGRRGAPGRAARAGELHPPRPDRRLGPVPRVRRGRLRGAQGHRPRRRPARRLPAVARARGAHPGVLLVARRSPTSTGSGSTPSSTWTAAPPGTSPRSCHEFAQSIGKDRFLLVGEITGSREDAIATMELTGLDAALGLAEVQSRLVGAATGAEDPAGYFALFRNSELIGKDSHTWLRDTVVTSRRPRPGPAGPEKARFGARRGGRALAAGAIALNATTLGIPCCTTAPSSSSTAAAGRGRRPLHPRGDVRRRRSAPFRSRDRHVFDETAAGVPAMPRCSRCAARARAAAGPAVPAGDLRGRRRCSASRRASGAGAQRGGVVAGAGPA